MERFLVVAPTEDPLHIDVQHRTPPGDVNGGRNPSTSHRVLIAQTLASEASRRHRVIHSEQARGSEHPANTSIRDVADRSWLDLDDSEDSSDDEETVRGVQDPNLHGAARHGAWYCNGQ